MTSQPPILDRGTAPLTPHSLRAAVLDEVHARPFTPISTPARIIHFAFDTSGPQAQADRENFVALCGERELPIPVPTKKQHRIALGDIILRWEQHSEFTTYTWEMPLNPSSQPFMPDAASLAPPMWLVPQPGPLLVAIDLHLLTEDSEHAVPEGLFDKTSLAVAESSDGTALYATDFKPDTAGFVRILIADRGMSAELAGALVQRVIEIETYRMLALLGLPEAQRLAPSIGSSEKRLVDVTQQMRGTSDLASNHRLLHELMVLANEVEANAAASVFRFGASRAYEELVEQRLQTIGERKVEGFPTWSLFLARRMKPAMRTCVTLEARQSSLSLNLARAVNLLRTRVDVELEQQNQELLKSMNARTRLQLRLQTTVEGLSVAAITYYVVGLFGYLVKAVHDTGRVTVEPSIITAIFVPVAAITIWSIIRSIRKKHVVAEE